MQNRELYTAYSIYSLLSISYTPSEPGNCYFKSRRCHDVLYLLVRVAVCLSGLVYYTQESSRGFYSIQGVQGQFREIAQMKAQERTEKRAEKRA